jgi:hypothetical protein
MVAISENAATAAWSASFVIPVEKSLPTTKAEKVRFEEAWEPDVQNYRVKKRLNRSPPYQFSEGFSI